MNRFTARGLIDEAQQGRKVIVVTTAMREATGYFVGHLPGSADVRRSGSSTSIWFDEEATISIITPTDMRGRSADVVFLDSDIAAKALDGMDMYQSALGAIHGSSHGEIIRA